MRLPVLAFAAVTLIAAPSLRADECIDAVKGEYLDCKADCREQFQTAKDACLARDHACVEVCRAEREECRDATGIDEDLESCRLAKEAAIAECKADFEPGTIERDICIDNAQVDAFVCRDMARETWKDELGACREAFRTCATACAPAVGGPVDPGQCRRDARAAYKACIADCREDAQLGKDTCRNRDHECVEQCRADRETCRDPVRAQLAADVASCNTTRDDGIEDDCLVNFPAPGPEQDDCIDGYQVVAFQCRDAAREAARPGFAACRDGFRSCATACPPATP